MAATTTSQRVFKRRGGAHSSGHRSMGKEHHTANSMGAPSNLPGVYSNPDMAYALVAIVGCVVDVQMQSGVAYQGVLQAVSPKLSLALALAHDKAKEPSIQNIEELMQLEFADVVSVSVLPDTNSSFSSKDIFKTDTEISRTNGSGYSKELQPFTFEDDGATISFTDEQNSQGWSAEDMFAINKKKFNVESSFNEEMTEYTTKLDRADTKDFKMREQRAEKLAKEIEGSSNKHGIDDVGTEEELFSAVVRQDVAPPPSSVPKHASKHTHNRHHQVGTRMVTEGQSYSSVAESNTESKLAAKGSDSHGTNSSQGGTSSSLSQTDGGSSQECQLTPSADMDCMNARGGASQEYAVSLSGEANSVEKNSVLEEGSQESLGQTVAEEEEEEEEGGGGGGGQEREEEDEAATEVSMSEDKVITSEEEVGVPPGFEKNVVTAEKVRKFQLDPNAKTFSLNLGAKEFVPSSFTPPTPNSPLTQSSSSPSVLESSSSQQPATHHTKKHPKRMHTHSYTPPDSVSFVPLAGGGGGGGGGGGSYVYPQVPGPIVTHHHQVPNQQILQYSGNVPQFPYHTPSGFINAQNQMMNTGQKFMNEVSPSHQVYAGNQQYVIQQQQLPHGQIIVSGSQPGLVTTPPSVMVMQGAQGPMYPHMQVAGVMAQGQGAAAGVPSRIILSTQQPLN